VGEYKSLTECGNYDSDFFAVQDSICPAGGMIDVHTRQWGQDVDEITQSSFSLHVFVMNIVPIR
jgi:hypothetical protein